MTMCPPADPSPAGIAPAPFWTTLPDIGVLGFDGPDAASFLQGQLSNDVAALAPGHAQWSSYNSPKGRMLGTLLLWRAGPDSFRAWLAADLAESLRKRLAMYVLRARVQVTDRTHHGPRFGVGGAGAGSATAAALGATPAPGCAVEADGVAIVASPDGRILVQPAQADADAVAARLAAHAASGESARWHLLGVRAGVPLVTAATADLFVPQSANWDLVGGVNFKKGCYPGQEIVARMHYLGRLKERAARFRVEGPPPPAAARVYGDVFGDQPCGTVLNAAPTAEGGSELLAVVQWAALESGKLRLGAPDGPALARLPLPYPLPAPEAPDRPKLG
jgi:folate-binding protein YgfZ